MTGTALPPHAPPLMRISCDRYHAMIEQGVLTENDRIELINGYLINREAKIPLHAACGIPEAWLVDLSGRSVTVFSAPDGANFTAQRTGHSGESVPVSAPPDAAIPVAEFGL